MTKLEGAMVYTDPYSEEYISDADLWQPDEEGQLVAAAHRIANGDSSHPPTVEMIKALVAELANARALWQGALAADGGDIPF